jgi:acyl-CoA thioester hydrolase
MASARSTSRSSSASARRTSVPSAKSIRSETTPGCPDDSRLPGRQESRFPARVLVELARLGGISWHNKVGVVAWSEVMLERSDPAPLFFAPFVSSVLRVEPQWIDYNGHLNMAYYNVLFDRAVDETYELIGVGADYVAKFRQSVFTAEVHVRFLRELHAGDPVRVTFQLLDYDEKRLHYFEQLFHAEDGWVSATSENLSLHVDLRASKTIAFPREVASRLAEMKSAHARLPRPEAAGRRIGMRAR